MKEKSARVPLRGFDRQSLILLPWSLLLSAAVVLGGRLHIEDNYAGTIAENYFLPFRRADLLLFLAVFLTAQLAAGFLTGLSERRGRECRTEEAYRGAAKGKAFLLLWPALFLAWLPYFLKFSPGFIPTDAVISLQEALGLAPMTNRQPMIFALLLRFLVFVTGGFRTKDVTAACMIFSLCQMAFLSGSAAYLMAWLKRRFRLKPLLVGCLAAIYGLSPYLAQSSITMWKDPAFSGLLVLWTLRLADFCLDPELIEKRSWRLGFLLIGLLTCFWRSNGITTGLMTALLAACLCLRGGRDRRARLKKLLVCACVVCLIWFAVVGPVCKLAGIGGIPPEESAGVMLNQMARVAAEGGRMSEEDRAFLNALLPIEYYPEEYRPCSVDLLKWSERFYSEPLYSSQFYRTWVSLLLKNPRSYLEAWLMGNYGFWTVNRPEINLATSFGDTYNLVKTGTMEIGGYIVRFEPLADTDNAFFRHVGSDAWSLPLGLLNWLLFALALALIRRREAALLLALAPTLGLALGVLISTPIWYLPRYELAVQLLTPFYLLLLFRGSALRGKETGTAYAGERRVGKND